MLRDYWKNASARVGGCSSDEVSGGLKQECGTQWCGVSVSSLWWQENGFHWNKQQTAEMYINMRTHRLVILLAWHQRLQWHWSQTAASYQERGGDRWINTHQLIHVQSPNHKKKTHFLQRFTAIVVNFIWTTALQKPLFCCKLSGNSLIPVNSHLKKEGKKSKDLSSSFLKKKKWIHQIDWFDDIASLSALKNSVSSADCPGRRTKKREREAKMFHYACDHSMRYSLEISAHSELRIG